MLSHIRTFCLELSGGAYLLQLLSICTGYFCWSLYLPSLVCQWLLCSLSLFSLLLFPYHVLSLFLYPWHAHWCHWRCLWTCPHCHQRLPGHRQDLKRSLIKVEVQINKSSTSNPVTCIFIIVSYTYTLINSTTTYITESLTSFLGSVVNNMTWASHDIYTCIPLKSPRFDAVVFPNVDRCVIQCNSPKECREKQEHPPWLQKFFQQCLHQYQM